MEFTNHQLLALNNKLPVGFKVEPIVRKEPRPRRSEAENLDTEMDYSLMSLGKRPVKDKPLPEDTETRQSEGYRKVMKILQTIKKHESATPFLDPIDPRQVPGYNDTIKTPMDLSLVERKLRQGDYETSYQFALDVRTIWNNSFYFNSRHTDLFRKTMEMSVMFEKLLKNNENLLIVEKKDEVQSLHRQVHKLSKGYKEMQDKTKPPAEQPMSNQEKKNLCEEIKNLEQKYLSGLLSIVRESTNIQGKELEFDIEKLPSKVCRELDKYVKQCKANAARAVKTKPVEEPKRDVSSNKLRELDREFGKVTEQPRNEKPPEIPDDDVSSSSESEDDYPITEIQVQIQPTINEPQPVQSLYDAFKPNIDIESDQDICDFGFGTMIDIDNQPDMLG